MPGGLALSLNNALSGLNVSQQSLAVLSQNIANANTKGYSRQILNQQSIYLDGQGSGVQILDITRKIDDYLTKAVQGQNSTVGQTGVINDYLARIQLLVGQPGNNNSLSTFVTSFFNALHSLAQTPEDTTLQRTAVNSATTLAQGISGLASSLEQLQFQADGDIKTAVNNINKDLTRVSELNVQISNAAALGKGTADLEDQRDNAIADIAQYINIQTYKRENGSLNITTSSGIALLDDNNYQLTYTQVADVSTFANNSPMSAIKVQQVDANGNPTNLPPQQLVSSAPPAQVQSVITSGKLKGLLDIRDTSIPQIISQLDTMASTLRDTFNAIHNTGTAFPGAHSYTSSRLTSSLDFNNWSGNVRIAVLQSNGQPITSPYSDEPYGVKPLSIDLSKLDTGQGVGQPSIQGLINEINQYYGVPQNKAETGNLNNIRLAADSNSIPGPSSLFNFDFDLDSLSGTDSDFFVTNIQVLDSTNTNITNITQNVPTVALDPVNTYITTANSNVVTVNTTGTNNGLANGDVVYLSNPGTVDGIPGSNISGYFTVSNVTATSFQVVALSPATTGTTTGVAGQTVMPPLSHVDAGGTKRTKDDQQLTMDLSGNPLSAFYTINVDVGVDDGSGNIKTSTISYRINNGQSNLLGTRVSAFDLTGTGKLVIPTSNQPIATATLVDANGNELPKINGQYTTLQGGYLKLTAGGSTNVIAIDSLDSVENGQPNTSPPVAGTGRGFSYYFDLNDFFKSNVLTNTGDTVAGSALALQVEQRLQQTPGLISLGKLVQSASSSDPTQPPAYTYERHAADDTYIQQMASLGNVNIGFPAANGLSATSQSFIGYVGQIIGATSTNANNAKTNDTNANTLLDGYTQRVSTISGVNLDTELANTVIYQNAYAASARVITVANDLFTTLLGAFQ